MSSPLYLLLHSDSIYSTVVYITSMTRRPFGRGCQHLFTQQKELTIVDLVRADNAIRLHQKILADRIVFNNINHVRITTIRRILGKNTASP